MKLLVSIKIKKKKTQMRDFKIILNKKSCLWKLFWIKNVLSAQYVAVIELQADEATVF